MPIKFMRHTFPSHTLSTMRFLGSGWKTDPTRVSSSQWLAFATATSPVVHELIGRCHRRERPASFLLMHQSVGQLIGYWR